MRYMFKYYYCVLPVDMAVGVHQDLRYLWRLRHMQRGLPRLVWQIDVSTAVYQQLNHVHLVVQHSKVKRRPLALHTA